MGTQVGPILLLICNRRSCRNGQSALLQQNDHSGVLGIFILDNHWELETGIPSLPTPCAVGAVLPWGARGCCRVSAR